MVDEINDIDVLLKQSKHLITDEKDLDTLENEKQSQLKDLEQISLRLKETLDPDDTTTYLVSQEFEAVIEDQILSRSSNKSILENLKNEISNLSSKIATTGHEILGLMCRRFNNSGLSSVVVKVGVWFIARHTR